MKIVIITADFPKILGGVSDYVFHLANAFKNKAGCEIFIITSKNNKVTNPENIKVLPVIEHWDLRALKPILELIREIKPDVVNLQYVPYMYQRQGIPLWIIFLCTYLKLTKVKLVTTFHEVAVRFDFNPKNILTGFIQRIIAYFIAASSYKSITSIELWKKMLFPFNCNTRKIPIGSNFIPFPLSSEKIRKLKKENASNNELIISTYGNNSFFTKYKPLFEAITEITFNDKLFPIKVIVFGANCTKLISFLKAEFKGSNLESFIKFTGHLESEEAYNLLSISDLFIALHTDIREGISIKSGWVAAAYAAGLPIIGSRGSVTDDFFINNYNVLFTKSTAKKDIKETIIQLYENKKVRDELAKGARKTYKEKLDWEVIAERHLEVFS